MAKPKNHVIYDTDQETLVRLKEEYESLGRQTKLEDGRLIVLALPPRRR
jgi:hypothetical protein